MLLFILAPSILYHQTLAGPRHKLSELLAGETANLTCWHQLQIPTGCRHGYYASRVAHAHTALAGKTDLYLSYPTRY
jgi:hypothetical protein